MKHRQTALVLSLAGVTWLAACGGSPRPPSPPPPPAPDAGAAVASTAPKPDDSPPPPPQKTAADHHRDFMGGCAKKAINSPDYCECAWDEFRKLFTDEEMNASELSEAKLEKVKTQVMGACASKIPEELVRSGFADGCMAKRPEMKVYCDCTWTEFRKHFSAAELGDEGTVTGPRFAGEKRAAIKACEKKIPESVPRDAFMKVCAKDPVAEKYCGCAWKELRKSASPAEIDLGTFDQNKAFVKVDKVCGKLRPAAPSAP
jgi:hypothetical protein